MERIDFVLLYGNSIEVEEHDEVDSKFVVGETYFQS